MYYDYYGKEVSYKIEQKRTEARVVTAAQPTH